MYMTMMVIMRPLGLGRSVEISEPAGVSGGSGLKVMPSASEGPPVINRGGKAPNIKSGQGGGPHVEDPSADGTLSQKIGKMVEEAEKMVRGDGAELEDSDEPRNPKKRVMDISEDGMAAGDVIDELEEGQQWRDAPEQQVETDQMRDEL